MRNTIDMAREAGILKPIELLDSNQWRQDTIRELKAFEALVRADERAVPCCGDFDKCQQVCMPRAAAQERESFKKECEQYANWLDEAAADIEDWGMYASEYLQQKWDLPDQVQDYKNRAAAIRNRGKQALAAPVQEFVCSTGLCHYKPAAQPAQKRHVSYVCPQCHWSLEKQTAPVQSLPFGVGGGLVAIKTLLSRDPCGHANTAIEMINAILAEQPTTEDSSEAQAELEATNRQVEILSDALAESRRQRLWVGLTDEEKHEIELKAGITEDDDGYIVSQVFRLIEAKLKELNT